MSHTMKPWERVEEVRLREQVMICEQQYGLIPTKSTTDATIALLVRKSFIVSLWNQRKPMTGCQGRNCGSE